MLPSKRSSTLLHVVFFLSGTSALIYEVVWTRLLTLQFGVTAYAVATVVAAFMAGLAIGSAVLGRLADRWRRHLRAYAGLELAIGLVGLLMPSLLALGGRVAAGSLGAAGGVGLDHALGTFLVASLALLLPTTLMGATLPVLAKHVTVDVRAAGRRIGTLYAVNTWGGVVGSVASAFLLIALLGVHATNLIAAGINFLLAAVTIVMARRDESAAPAAPSESAPVDEAREVLPDTTSPTLVGLAYAAAGAVALAIQVLLTRFAIFFLWDTTVYSFAAVLTTFLAGLAIGSSLIVRWVDRWRALLGVFGLLQIGVGLAAIALLSVLDSLSDVRARLWSGLYEAGELVPWRYLGLKFLMAVVLVLPPTILMGATFPVVNRLVARRRATLGRRVGGVYAANTVGAILGSLVGGFWLVPHVGIVRGLLAVGAVSVVMGVLVISRERTRSVSWRTVRAGAGLAVLGLLITVAPRDRTAVSYSDLLSGRHGDREVLYYHEGLEASLAVLRDPSTGVRELNINGQSTAFTTYMDLQVHRALGHLPALCHPDPRSALVIGFGFGSTCHAIRTHGVERLDCVELVAAERETAGLFANVNGSVMDDPSFRFIEGDGRHHVLITDDRYDLLSFNAIHPKLSASLYTLEFYELCRERLTENGVIAAWLPINFLSGDEFRMLTRTFQHVFPHATMWYVGPGHAVLLGHPEPLVLDYARIEERLAMPALAADLAESNLDDPGEIITMYVADEDAVRAFSGDGPLNTDDRPHIEYGISFSSREWYETLQHIHRVTMAALPPLRNVDGPWGDAESVTENLSRYLEARRYSMFGGIMQTVGLSARSPEMMQQGIDAYRKALEIVPESRNTRRLLEDKVRGLETLRRSAGAAAAP